MGGVDIIVPASEYRPLQAKCTSKTLTAQRLRKRQSIHVPRLRGSYEQAHEQTRPGERTPLSLSTKTLLTPEGHAPFGGKRLLAVFFLHLDELTTYHQSWRQAGWWVIE